MNKNKINSLNSIGRFLAKRDLSELTKTDLNKNFGIEKVDVLILLGSAITYNIKVAVEAYKNKLCSKILICGGIGHSTELLRKVVREHKNYDDVNTYDKPEADIIYEIILKHFNIPKEDIIIENKSTNCGDNAIKAIEILDELGINYSSLILIQDPTMQLRTYLGFLKVLKNKNKVKVLNYAPFIPILNENLEFENSEVDGIWSLDRYETLVLGEIPRLRDDENGYGPKGANYIEHIDIPKEIEEHYLILSNILGKETR
ncbi:YdcF family protein [Clostridium perfringens]|nr:YdcF family protein [Clostridium perfringens]